VVGRVTVDDEAAATMPVRLAALREHESVADGPGEGAASTRPDWLVVGAVAVGVTIVLGLGTLVWFRSPVATANTTGPTTSGPVVTAPPATAPPIVTTRPGLPLPAPTVRPSATARVPAPVAPHVEVAPRPISGGTTSPATGNGNTGNGNTGNGNTGNGNNGNGSGNNGNGDGGGGNGGGGGDFPDF